MNKAMNNTITKPQLLTVADAEKMTMAEGITLFGKHINPGLAKMYKILGLAGRKPVKAEGLTITMDDGSQVLDLTAGLAVLNIGHNHPRIMKAREKWASEKQLEIWKFIPSPYQAALAKNLSSIFPGDLNVVFFCNSGAEANEGALKMAEKYAGQGRHKIVYTDISFHGKTHATLSVTGSEKKQNKHFKMLPDCLEIPYGNADALEKVLKENKELIGKCKVGTFIVEAIRSEGVIQPPPGYFKRVRQLCDKYDVVLIMDEVFCGFGRTGKMFAFEHHDIVPDIVSFSKAFGAGKASFGGYIATDRIFNKAYGTIKEATMHSTTYNGFGEEVITALESINVIYDEHLLENSRDMGAYFLGKLKKVQECHPAIVKDVRGVGLLINIRLESAAARVAKLMPGTAMPDEIIGKVTTGGVITELYENHNILTYTPLHDNNLLMITPALTITKEEIDRFITAFDSVLKTNLAEKGMKYLKRFLAK